MKWQFKEKATQELEVIIQKLQLDQEVTDFVAYIERFGRPRASLIPIKTADGVQLLKFSALIAVEVEGSQLRLYTTQGEWLTTDRLYKFKARLDQPALVQVSKQSLINISHLARLEASFSGNMLAFMTDRVKIQVSRRYLKALEKAIGL